MARRVAIVPHTHWDREWYSPFQTFRLRLVDVLDELLPLLEGDPSYTHFLLDGQMAVVDDYLEVRPEAAPRLRSLVLAGRLAVGPWYTLADEFLVSGETLVRDLQLGLARAADIGGAMPVGYLPDMFGHVAQMPQLLALAGLRHAVVWRGVPAAVDRSAFWWEAPDGTRVRAEYLLGGYGNAQDVPDDPRALVHRVAAFEAAWAPFLLDGLLLLNGTDHQAPQPWVGRVTAAADALQDDYEVRISSLAAYLDGAPVEGLPVWRGELRSGARANLLMGVASNRVDVKQAAAVAERTLERVAEPVAALFLPADRWPGRLLDVAWLHMIRNAAHDSVCACSADEVVDAVAHRYAEARQVADGVARRAVDAVASSMADAGWVVVNPAPRPRSVVVEVEVPGEGPLPGAQVVVDRRAVLDDRLLAPDEARRWLAGLTSQLLGPGAYVREVAVTEDAAGPVHLDVRVDRELVTNLVMQEVAAEVLARLDARPGAPLHLFVHRVPSRLVVLRVPDVPGHGWKLIGDVAPPPAPVEVTEGGLGLTSALVSVVVDPATGTFALDGIAGCDRLVDGGDAGDTYNYSPPAVDVEVDAPDAVAVDVVEHGPVRGRLRVVRRYRWPAGVVDGRRAGQVPVEVVTVLEVRAGEAFVRVTTSFDNRCRDHRLRTLFPLPQRAATSRAECAFAVVERGLAAEGGPHEVGLPTFPSRRFVSAGGLTVVHDGLPEYELVHGGDALALTLLRATGMLSRVDLAYRPLPAGPPIALEGPQLQGRHQVRYAVCADPQVDPYALADEVLLPAFVRPCGGGGTRPASGSALSVTGAEVSAVRRVGEALELRLFNPTPAPATAVVDRRRGAVVDLRGTPTGVFEGDLRMRPWEVATLRLDDAPVG